MDATGPRLSDLLTALPALRPLVAGDEDARIGWVHGSDLADPSPFLEAGTMLLTTGTQFRDDREIGPWTDALVAVGVTAIGFGTEVVRSTPGALVESCRNRGVPLVEIPYAVPFIAVVRAVADLHAARAHERDTWSLAAQRALAVASLGDGGLDNVLQTLAARLDGTVVLFGGDGTVRRRYALREVDAARLDALGEDARRLLGRGGRASGSASDGHDFSAVHTFGRTDASRGAVGIVFPGPDDAAARAVVTGAVAIAEVTVDRDLEVARVGADLADRAVRLLADDRHEAAAAVAEAAGRPFAASARVAVIGTGGAGHAALRALADAGIAVGTLGSRTTAVVGEDRVGFLERVASDARVAVGISRMAVTTEDGAPVAGAFASAFGQASVAADRADEGSVRSFAADPPSSGIVLGAAVSEGAVTWAEERLRSVDRVLLGEAAVWLEENAQWEPAARRLGLHRHVLRHHVEATARELGLDVRRFGDRAELWALLVAGGLVPDAFR